MTIALFLLLAAMPADWKHVQQFDVVQPGLIKLSLPVETIDAARPGLEDLRIVDSAGQEVPYLVQRPLGGKALTAEAAQFVLAAGGLEDGGVAAGGGPRPRALGGGADHHQDPS